MEKKIKILIVVLIASMFIGSSLINAKFAVTIGQVNIYDVVESEWDYTFDSWDSSYESSGTGFEFNDQLYSLDEQVSVTVTGADALAVEYNVSVGTESESHYATGFSVIGIYFLLQYPFAVVGMLEYNLLFGYADLGLSLHGLYFIEPYVVSEMFTELADDNYIASEYVNEEDWTYNYVNGIFDSDDNIAVFTWRFDARHTVWTDDTDISGEYTLVIEYDQTTGELQRYDMEFDYSGILGYDTVSMEYSQEVKIQGYQNNTPGFSWSIAIPALVVLGLFGVIINKRKKINRQ